MKRHTLMILSLCILVSPLKADLKKTLKNRSFSRAAVSMASNFCGATTQTTPSWYQTATQDTDTAGIHTTSRHSPYARNGSPQYNGGVPKWHATTPWGAGLQKRANHIQRNYVWHAIVTTFQVLKRAPRPKDRGGNFIERREKLPELTEYLKTKPKGMPSAAERVFNHKGKTVQLTGLKTDEVSMPFHPSRIRSYFISTYDIEGELEELARESTFAIEERLYEGGDTSFALIMRQR